MVTAPTVDAFPPRTDRTALLMLAACLVPLLVLVWRSWGFLPPIEHGDYAHYLLHAKAIATGRSYDDTGFIYSSASPLIGPRNQLPGWPLILAPFVAIFGDHSAVFRVLEVVALIAFVLLAGWYFAKRDGPLAGGAIALMVPVALEAQYATYAPISDLPFCVCLWGMVVVADREGRWTWTRGFGILSLAIVALSMRAAGAALLPALLLFGLTRPAADRRFILRPTLAAAMLGAAIALALPDIVPFRDQLFKNLQAILSRPLTGWRIFSGGAMNGLLYPFPWNQANDLYHAVLVLPVAIGTFVFLWRYRRTMLWWTAIVYSVMLAFSPVQAARYLWPLLPLLTYVAFIGVRELASRMTGQKPVLGSRLAFGVFGLVSLLSAGRLLQRPAPHSILGDPAVQDLFAWLRRENSVSPLRVVFMNPRVLTLETGIPAMGSLPARDWRALRELRARRVTHVIIGDAGGGLPMDKRFARFVLDRPAVFAGVHSNQLFQVFRIEEAALARVVADSTGAPP